MERNFSPLARFTEGLVSREITGNGKAQNAQVYEGGQVKVIIGGRGSGKTTNLIKMCAKKGGYIVCQHRREAHRIFWMAKDMEVDIPHPITYDEFLNGRYYGLGVRIVYIDNADMLVQAIALRGGVEVNAITLTKAKDKKEG